MIRQTACSANQPFLAIPYLYICISLVSVTAWSILYRYLRQHTFFNFLQETTPVINKSIVHVIKGNNTFLSLLSDGLDLNPHVNSNFVRVITSLEFLHVYMYPTRIEIQI